MADKVRQVCATCGSEDVLADAWASWNVEDQRWEVEDTFSKGAHCRNCDGECRIEEAPFDPDAEDKADAQAAQDALDRLADGTDRLVTGEELERRLAAREE